jgi:hypothetical protein
MTAAGDVVGDGEVRDPGPTGGADAGCGSETSGNG